MVKKPDDVDVEADERKHGDDQTSVAQPVTLDHLPVICAVLAELGGRVKGVR